MNQGHKLELEATENNEEEVNSEPEIPQEQPKDEGILAHSGLTPDGIFQAFDKATNKRITKELPENWMCYLWIFATDIT